MILIQSKACYQGLHTKKEDIDFNEISPVVKYRSIKIVLPFVAHLDLKLEQHEVKTTFLHRDLEEEKLWVILKVTFQVMQDLA